MRNFLLELVGICLVIAIAFLQIPLIELAGYVEPEGYVDSFSTWIESKSILFRIAVFAPFGFITFLAFRKSGDIVKFYANKSK